MADEAYKREVLAVRELCEKIGYGNVMDIAGNLWAIMLQDKGFPISGAFFTAVEPMLKKREAEECKFRRSAAMKYIREKFTTPV